MRTVKRSQLKSVEKRPASTPRTYVSGVGFVLVIHAKDSAQAKRRMKRMLNSRALQKWLGSSFQIDQYSCDSPQLEKD